MHVSWAIRDYMQNPDGMVAVTTDPATLYEKMTTDNLEVCVSCIGRQEAFGDFTITGFGAFRCPVGKAKRISLIDDHTLPKGCPRKFEHGVALSLGKDKHAF